MRAAKEVREDIATTATELAEQDERRAELRKQLGRLLVEARDHPHLTLEEARVIPAKPIPRQTANELVKAARNTERRKL